MKKYIKRYPHILLLTLLLFSICCQCGQCFADETYSVIDLTIDDSDTRAYSINNQRKIVGWDPSEHCPILWENYVPNRLPGFDASGVAIDINNYNQVVGVHEGDFVERATFIWQNNSYIDLACNGNPFDINDAGYVSGCTGKVEGPVTNEYAYVWKSGKFTNLGEGRAYATTNSGAITVGCVGSDPRSVSIWDNGTQFVLGQGIATSVNEFGQVVGHNNGVPFLWEHGNLTYLPNEIGQPEIINNKGQIVGSGGYLWDHGNLVDLRTYTPSGSFAEYINDLSDVLIFDETNKKSFLLQSSNPTLTEPPLDIYNKVGKPTEFEIVSGISYQNEGTRQHDVTEIVRSLDDNWAPVPQDNNNMNYYATSASTSYWDALSLHFDLSSEDYHYIKTARFMAYVRQGSATEYPDWHHFRVYPGAFSPIAEDSWPYDSGEGWPFTYALSFDPTNPGWISYDIPTAWITSSDLGLSLRLWNAQVDQVKLYTEIVPEPASFVLFGMGGLAMGLLKRRKKIL